MTAAETTTALARRLRKDNTALDSENVGVPTASRATFSVEASAWRMEVVMVVSEVTVAMDNPVSLKDTALTNVLRGVLGVGTGAVGVSVGSGEGAIVGRVGRKVGCADGCPEGRPTGCLEGCPVGCLEGCLEG